MQSKNTRPVILILVGLVVPILTIIGSFMLIDAISYEITLRRKIQQEAANNTD
jgi:hypothetical protein